MNLALEATWPSAVVGFGIDLAVKSTAILMIVLLLQALVGRRRAYLGAAVGNAGLIALLLLPASALIFPPVAIAWRLAESAPVQPPSVVSFPPTASHDAAPSSPRPVAAPIISAARPVPASVQVESSVPAALPRLVPLDWATLAVALYLLGAMVLTARLCRSVLAIARLRRSCEQVHDVEWTNALESWRRHLEIGRKVGLYRSPEVRVPLALGWLKPAVVLPESLAADTFRGHRDSVLIHELAHVRRGDYPWNLCLRLVQIFYWPHLLVWILGRVIVSLRERACDDLCISKLGGTSAYRESLIAVAAEMTRRPHLALGLAMASTSKLGRRLAQIDRSDGNHRCLPGRQVNVFIAMTTFLMASIIGMMRLEPVEARVMTAEASQLVDQTGRIFHLQVVAADTDEPVADAEVRVWMGFRDEWRKADSQGRLDITHSTGPSDRDFGIDVLGKGRAMQRHHWGLDRTKPIPDGATVKLLKGETLGGIVQDENGKPIAMATVLLWSHNYKKNDPHEILYDLRAMTGPDGRWQTSSAPETTGELLNFQVRHPHFLSDRDYTHDKGKPSIADLRAETAVMVMKKGVPIEGRVVDADGKPVVGARIVSTDSRFSLYQDVGRFEVSTGPDGRFRTGQVKPGEWAIVATAKGRAPALQRVEIVTETPRLLVDPHHRFDVTLCTVVC